MLVLNTTLFRTIFAAIRGNMLYQIYSSIIPHLKSAVAKEINGLRKIIQNFLIVQNVIATAIPLA